MIHYLCMGALLGFSAGMAPGPLLTLVVSETLEHGAKAGVRVALAPVVTDFPIILASVFLLSRLSGFHSIMGMISLVGGCVIFSMGIKSVKSSGTAVKAGVKKNRSLAKGILVNFLSPHPYLFWISVGAPVVARAMEAGIAGPLAFVGSFYLLLVGSKTGLALVTERSRVFLKGRVYVFTLKGLGLALCILALVLFKDGVELLGIL